MGILRTFYRISSESLQMILDIMSYTEPGRVALGRVYHVDYLLPPTYAENVHITKIQKIKEIHIETEEAYKNS